MKTVIKNKDVRRVTDKEAEKMILQGWSYCPKSIFKNLGKDTDETAQIVEIDPKKKEKTKKKK